MGDLITSLKKAKVSDEARFGIYKRMIDAFEDHDCDTLDECENEDPMFDKALRVLKPEWYEDEQ